MLHFLERYRRKKEKNVVDNSSPKEKVKLYSNLSEVLDLVEQSLVDVTDRGGTIKRIINPFEARIDKKSITLDCLKRIGSLPIEIGIAHDNDGDLILNTGVIRSSSMYDFGPIETWVPGNNLLDDKIVHAQHEAHKLLVERNKSSSGITVHNHPSGSLRPSLGDLNFFSDSKSKRHFIITRTGICILNTDFDEEKLKMIKEYQDGPGSELDYFKKPEHDVFLKSLGVIEKVVMFEDSEIHTVIAEL